MVTAGMVAEDEPGTGGGIDAERVVGDDQTPIALDLKSRPKAPDEGPPRTVGNGSEGGPVLGQGGVPSGLGSHFEFAVELMSVAMKPQRLDGGVGLGEIANGLAGEEGGQPGLPDLMVAFDLTLGLGGGGVPKGNAVEVKSLLKLGHAGA